MQGLETADEVMRLLFSTTAFFGFDQREGMVESHGGDEPEDGLNTQFDINVRASANREVRCKLWNGDDPIGSAGACQSGAGPAFEGSCFWLADSNLGISALFCRGTLPSDFADEAVTGRHGDIEGTLATAARLECDAAAMVIEWGDLGSRLGLRSTVLNEAPRLRYMSGGQVEVPLVLKAGYGFAAGWGGQHSNCIYHTMMGIPGLKVALPSTPADAKGLMASAIRDDNPVVYLHHYMLTLDTGDVPEGEYLVPFGVADIKRAGSDVTIVATGWMVKKSLAAAEELDREGISAEVIDPRTLAPLRCGNDYQFGQEDGKACFSRSGAAAFFRSSDHRCRSGRKRLRTFARAGRVGDCARRSRSLQRTTRKLSAPQ